MLLDNLTAIARGAGNQWPQSRRRISRLTPPLPSVPRDWPPGCRIRHRCGDPLRFLLPTAGNCSRWPTPCLAWAPSLCPQYCRPGAGTDCCCAAPACHCRPTARDHAAEVVPIPPGKSAPVILSGAEGWICLRVRSRQTIAAPPPTRRRSICSPPARPVDPRSCRTPTGEMLANGRATAADFG